MTRAAVVSAAARANHPARLCWVGATEHAEARSVWGWLKRNWNATQRDTLADLASHPVAGLRHGIVFRSRRSPLDVASWHAAVALHPLAQWAAFNASLCEGEGRTGQPWRGFTSLAAREGEAGLAGWLTASGGRHSSRQDASAGRLVVGLVAAQYRDVDAIADFVRTLGDFAVWVRPHETARLEGVNVLLIDDSAAALANCGERMARLRRPGRRIGFCVSISRARERDRLRANGIDKIFPKPGQLHDIVDWLASAR